MIRRPPRSTLFPTRRSSDLPQRVEADAADDGREPAPEVVHRSRVGAAEAEPRFLDGVLRLDRKSTRLNSSHQIISYAVFCLKKKKQNPTNSATRPPRHRPPP